MDVPALVDRLGRRTDGVVTRQQLLRAGCTRAALDRARVTGAVVELQSVALAVPPLPERGRFVVDERAVDRRFRMDARAAVLVTGARAALRGRTALALLGQGLLVEPTDVELLVPHSGRRAARPGVDLRQALVMPEPRWLRRGTDLGLPCCAPLAAAAQVAQERPLVEAVVALDSLLRSGVVTRSQLAREAQCGVLADRRGRRAAALADGRSESVLESVARVRLVEAGLHGFTVQLRLCEGAALRVDLGYRRERLVVELDGSRYHPDGRTDRRRDRFSVVNGYRVLRWTWREVVNEPAEFVAVVGAALGR